MRLFLIFLGWAAIGSNARALELGPLPFAKLGRLQADRRADVLDHAAKVLTAFEAGGSITYRRGAMTSPDARALCAKAGWIFFSAPGLACDSREIHRGCEPGESRCASWTGRGGACVPSGGNALESCLKDRTKAERKLAEDFFSHRIHASNWADMWDAVRLRCQNGRLASCEKLQRLAVLARDLPSPFLGAEFSRARAEAAGSRAPAPRTWASLFFGFVVPEARCAVCGYDEKTNKFKKANGDEIAYEFGNHADTGGTAWMEEATKDMTKEELAADVDTFLQSQSAALKTYKEQRQRLKAAAESGKIEWVALEILPSNFKPEDIEEYRKSAQNMRERMQNAGIDPQKIDDVILAGWGPYLTDAIKNEPWTQKAKPIAADSSELKTKGNEFLNNMDDILTGMKKKADAGQIPKDKFEALSNLVKSKIQAGNLTLNEKEAREMVAKFPADSYLDAQRVIYHLTAFLKTSNDRDKVTAGILQNQNGNGAIVMGSAHQQGVTEVLRSACKTNNKAAPPAKNGGVR